MIWFVYILCGAGVMLALDDERGPLGLRGLLVALICVALWPMMFMFALTTTLRSLADHAPRDITVPMNPRVDAKDKRIG